ncbi:MAG TPA: sigma-70 family RNA polymerase sigma factor [Tepidisphaeraceae bacterium]|nr:sigma-70 family RNA polymerase sigma factor [Tepidisphaeraceae bacterium]
MFDTAPILSAAMAAGDTRAVEDFYRRYFDCLYAHARRFTGRDEAFCLDVVQEAVLRIIRTVRTVKTEAQLSAWLKLVVQTAAYDLVRQEMRRHRREMVACIGSSQSGDPISSEQSDRERLEWLRSEISSFDAQLAEMLDLRFAKRWTLSRIAQSMGLSLGTVDGRLRRAVVELRRRAMEKGHD